MFFVIKTTLNSQPTIVGDTCNPCEKTSLLQTAVKSFVVKNFGLNYSEIGVETVDLENIIEPLIDTVKIYKSNNSDTLYVYSRSSTAVPGYIYGQTVSSLFKQIAIFNIVEYTNSNLVCNVPLTFVSTEITGVPLKLRIAPLSNLLSEIQNSTLFKNQKNRHA